LILSAYKTVLKFVVFAISLIYIRNSKGPRTDPEKNFMLQVRNTNICYVGILNFIVEAGSFRGDPLTSYKDIFDGIRKHCTTCPHEEIARNTRLANAH